MITNFTAKKINALTSQFSNCDEQENGSKIFYLGANNNFNKKEILVRKKDLFSQKVEKRYNVREEIYSRDKELVIVNYITKKITIAPITFSAFYTIKNLQH